MTTNDREEYYPPSFVYWDAEYPDPYGEGVRTLRGGEYNRAHEDNSWVLCSVYKIGEKTIQTSRLRLNCFPSFCGGVYAHSPAVNRIVLDDFNVRINGTPVEDRSAAGIKKLPLVNVKKWGVDYRTEDGWERYGLRVAAHGLLSYMQYHKRRGVVMSGRRGTGTRFPITTFVDELKSIKKVSGTRMEIDKLKADSEWKFGRQVCKWNVRNVNVDDTTEWENRNSSNIVKWFPINVEFDEDSYGVRNVSKQEKAYGQYGSKYSVIRNLWNNG